MTINLLNQKSESQSTAERVLFPSVKKIVNPPWNIIEPIKYFISFPLLFRHNGPNCKFPRLQRQELKKIGRRSDANVCNEYPSGMFVISVKATLKSLFYIRSNFKDLYNV